MPAWARPVVLPTDVDLEKEDDFATQAAAIQRMLLVERIRIIGLPVLLLLVLAGGVWWIWSASQARSPGATRPAAAEMPVTDKQRLLQALDGGRTVNLDALHQLADPGMSSGDERLGFLRRLVESRSATPLEEVDFCRLVLELQRPEEAEQVVERWLSTDTTLTQAGRMQVCGEYFSQTGRASEGLEWARQRSQALGVQQGRPSPADLLVARLLLDQPVWSTPELKENAVEAAGLLGRFLVVDPTSAERELHRDALILMDEVSARVPRVAEAMGNGAWSEAAKRARTLQAGERDVKLLLTEAGFRKRLLPKEELDDLFDELAGQIGPETPAADRLMWARWLMGNGQHDRAALVLGKSPELEANRGWFLAYLDALAGQRRWEEVEGILTRPHVLPVEETVARLYVWRCRIETGASPSRVHESRQSLLSAAAQATPSVVMYAAQYLDRFGDPSAAAMLYRRLTSLPEWKPAAGRGLWQALREDPAAEDEVRNCLREYVQLRPKDEEAAVDLVYLDLLEGRDVAACAGTAARLLQRLPFSLARRTTLALAWLQQERPQEAFALYPGLQLDWENVPSGFVAVWSAVLAASGSREEGIQLAKKLKPDSLRQGEQDLLQKHAGVR